MSPVREELHDLVDQLPDDQVAPVLAMVRSSVFPLERRQSALVLMDRVRERMRGVTGVDEEVDELRNVPRG